MKYKRTPTKNYSQLTSPRTNASIQSLEKKELKYEGKHQLDDGQYYVEIWITKDDDMVV